ncbi:MAG: aldehyde dehydrogenase family protein [Trueperaceae bacterium]|nr:aldehyde dehydrogenase family protein [Trueperaceae bacterium]
MPTDGPTAPRLPQAALQIDGQFLPAEQGQTRPTLDPATGRTLLKVPEADAHDVDAALRAARRAFDDGPWPTTPVQTRARLLERVADAIEQQTDELAWLETLDTGKTLIESRADMDQIAQVFRYYAAEIRTSRGDVNPVPTDALSLTMHEPLGVVAMITPWNYPLLQASWKIAPALAAGCTFVLKPSELTPLSTLRFGEMLEEAGLPAGVANVVTGAGGTVGAAMTEDPRVDLISFTGGIVTGRRIAAAASQHVTRIALELGGKNPNVVLEDADLDLATDHALNAVYYHAGQVCSAGSRLLVHEDLQGALVERILDRARRIRMGFGWENETEMGPVISAEHRDKVEGYVRLAQEEGAELVLGGGRPTDPRFADGTFLEPTVLTGLPHDGRVAREEIFGPVLTVETFADDFEAVRLASDTPTGLAAGVFTRDATRAVRMARRLPFGTVWINDFHPYYPEAPWGGFKQSGIGRELGRAGLREYQEEKHLYWNLDPAPAEWFGTRGSS